MTADDDALRALLALDGTARCAAEAIETVLALGLSIPPGHYTLHRTVILRAGQHRTGGRS